MCNCYCALMRWQYLGVNNDSGQVYHVNHLIKFGCPVVSLLAHLIDYSTMLCEYVTIKHWPKMCVIVLKKKTPKRKLGACDSIFLWKEERKDQWEGDCAYWPDRKANLWK